MADEWAACCWVWGSLVGMSVSKEGWNQGFYTLTFESQYITGEIGFCETVTYWIF